jgi:hypothetical protein
VKTYHEAREVAKAPLKKALRKIKVLEDEKSRTIRQMNSLYKRFEKYRSFVAINSLFRIILARDSGVDDDTTRMSFSKWKTNVSLDDVSKERIRAAKVRQNELDVAAVERKEERVARRREDMLRKKEVNEKHAELICEHEEKNELVLEKCRVFAFRILLRRVAKDELRMWLKRWEQRIQRIIQRERNAEAGQRKHELEERKRELDALKEQAKSEREESILRTKSESEEHFQLLAKERKSFEEITKENAMRMARERKDFDELLAKERKSFDELLAKERNSFEEITKENAMRMTWERKENDELVKKERKSFEDCAKLKGTSFAVKILLQQKRLHTLSLAWERIVYSTILQRAASVNSGAVDNTTPAAAAAAATVLRRRVESDESYVEHYDTPYWGGEVPPSPFFFQ